MSPPSTRYKCRRRAIACDGGRRGKPVTMNQHGQARNGSPRHATITRTVLGYCMQDSPSRQPFPRHGSQPPRSLLRAPPLVRRRRRRRRGHGKPLIAKNPRWRGGLTWTSDSVGRPGASARVTWAWFALPGPLLETRNTEALVPRLAPVFFSPIGREHSLIAGGYFTTETRCA